MLMSGVTSILTRFVSGFRIDANTSGELRVALITSSYNYIRDGIALTLNRMVEYLEAHGVRVLVIAPIAKTTAFAHKGRLFPVPSVPLPARPEYRLALGLSGAARRELNAFQPHIMHIAVPDSGLSRAQFGQQKQLPIVASYHTRYENYLTYYGLGVTIGRCRPISNGSTALVVNCTLHRSRWRRYLKAEGIRHKSVCGAGASTRRTFIPTSDRLLGAPSTASLDDELVICFVSRLVREKELDTLVDVLEGLRRRNVPHRSVIVGDGPDRNFLEQKLPGSIFTGFLVGDELARAYASSDIFLFPSETETFGNVTLEAMASGLVTVCADASGSRSLVVPAVTGFLAKPKRSEEFVGYIQRLADDSLPARADAGCGSRAQP